MPEDAVLTATSGAPGASTFTAVTTNSTTTPTITMTNGSNSDDERDLSRQPVWVQEIIKGLRQENAQRRLKEKETEERRLAEEGRYKELFEQREQQLAELRSQQAKEQRDRWALEATVAAGLPTEFATRLRGETQEELKTDADALKAVLPKAKAPDTEGGAGSGSSRSTPAQDYERLKEAVRTSGRFAI